MRNVIYQFQSLIDQDKPVRQYGRQTGITKNLATFWQKKILVIFIRSPVTLYAKRIMVISALVFPTVTLQIYKEILKKNIKGAITPKIFFLNLREFFRYAHDESYPKISKL